MVQCSPKSIAPVLPAFRWLLRVLVSNYLDLTILPINA